MRGTENRKEKLQSPGRILEARLVCAWSAERLNPNATCQVLEPRVGAQFGESRVYPDMGHVAVARLIRCFEPAKTLVCIS